MDTLLSLFSGGQNIILIVVAGIASLLGLFFAGRKQGKAAAEAARLKEEAKARQVSDDIDDAVAGRTPAENREKLGKWSKS